ncbi:LysR family transcriptional regulator, partial [Mesorhizobium sp. GbtcB19]
MIDWDDVRHFLAVARGRSVRAAAERPGVNQIGLVLGHACIGLDVGPDG